MFHPGNVFKLNQLRVLFHEKPHVLAFLAQLSLQVSPHFHSEGARLRSALVKNLDTAYSICMGESVGKHIHNDTLPKSIQLLKALNTLANSESKLASVCIGFIFPGRFDPSVKERNLADSDV